MAKYRHIVFDVDGTLIDTRDCILYSLQEMLMTVKGERYEIEDLKFVLANTSVKKYASSRGGREKIPGAVEMWVANEEKNIDMIRIFDGIEELLEKLEKKRSTLGVVTSRTREELELVLDQLPIRKYFSICICADDTKEHKTVGTAAAEIYGTVRSAERRNRLYRRQRFRYGMRPQCGSGLCSCGMGRTGNRSGCDLSRRETGTT